MPQDKLQVFNYSIRNQTEDSLDIYIDGDIVDASDQQFYKAWLGDDTTTSYKSFRDTILQSSAKTFNVFINSGGGLVTDAMAIHDLLIDLQDNKGKIVNTEGRGIVASSATYILMASNKPKMSKNSWLMIHNVSGFVFGDVNKVEKYASTMRKFNDASVSYYNSKTGIDKVKIEDMMNQETWMTADEAKAKGFVSMVTGDAIFTNKIKDEDWVYSNKSVLNFYNSFTKTNSPTMQVETKPITDAINEGFKKLWNKIKGKDNDTDPEVKEGFEEFSNLIATTISNSLKDVVPSQTAEQVQEIVNAAVAESLKTIGENDGVKNAISAAVATGVAQLVNKTDLETFKNDIITGVIAKIGNKTPTEQKDEKVVDKKKKNLNNKYSTVETDEWGVN